jgi:hypothetical protein
MVELGRDTEQNQFTNPRADRMTTRHMKETHMVEMKGANATQKISSKYCVNGSNACVAMHKETY